MLVVACKRAIAGGTERRDFAFAVNAGRIAATGSRSELLGRFSDAEPLDFGDDVIVVPGFVNGHSHAYQILIRGAADDLPFDRWRAEHLYRVVPGLTPEQVHETFARAFKEMLAAGITTVAEFFYLNGAGNAHAEAAISAARETGIRLIFARTWMDAPYAPAAFRESIGQARTRTQALMSSYPEANVCVAPHSLHAASPDMIRAAAAFAAEHDCMMHVHVAEAPYEGVETVRSLGETPVRALKQFGALNERSVAVHAIHIDEEEKSLLADAGARVVHNPMTNQYLGDGICDVVGLRARGVPIALGTDADVKPSLIDEMRAASMLQKIARLDGSALGAQAAFAMATAEGAKALRIDAGDLATGCYADFIAVDASTAEPQSPAINALVYRAEDRAVRETWTSGKQVYRR